MNLPPANPLPLSARFALNRWALPTSIASVVFAGGLGIAFGVEVFTGAIGVLVGLMGLWSSFRAETLDQHTRVREVYDVLLTELLFRLADPADVLPHERALPVFERLDIALIASRPVVPLPKSEIVLTELQKYVAEGSWDKLDVRNATLRALTEVSRALHHD